MKQATHFIEVVKYTDLKIIALKPHPIRIFNMALDSTKKFGYETVAVFKIAQKHNKQQ